jgi:hypothetical protein
MSRLERPALASVVRGATQSGDFRKHRGDLELQGISDPNLPFDQRKEDGTPVQEPAKDSTTVVQDKKPAGVFPTGQKSNNG